MTRRYLLAIVDRGGNVPPELHVALRLVERGHHVTVLAEDSVADEVRASGGSRDETWGRLDAETDGGVLRDGGRNQATPSGRLIPTRGAAVGSCHSPRRRK